MGLWLTPHLFKVPRIPQVPRGIADPVSFKQPREFGSLRSPENVASVALFSFEPKLPPNDLSDPVRGDFPS